MTGYEEIIELSIRRMAEVVGKHMAVGRAQQIEGVTVDDEGSVADLDDDGKAVLERLVDSYIEMAGEIPAALIASAIREEYDVERLDLPENVSKELDSVV